MDETIENTLLTPLALTAPTPLAEHPAAVYLSRLSSGSRPTMQLALDAISRLLTDGICDALTLNWAALRYKHTATVRATLIEKHSPAYVNKMLCALRRVLKEALRLELMDAVDFARAVDIPNVKVTKQLRGRALKEKEIADLMQVCFDDPTPTGYRDAALVAILRGSGVRRSEVVNLNLSDFDFNNGALKVRSGKGGKDRTVYLPDSALTVVSDWLSIRGDSAGPMLCHVNKCGRVILRRLTSQAVLFILQKRGEQVGVTDFSAHDFRRTFISDLLNSGEDISTVQRLAGHATSDQTARYDRRGEQTKRLAVQKLSIPGSRKKPQRLI
ncbi:tyrosine-type recombinase/integrase [Komarekiella sp. 'clone 1']|uniref:Tyrosine-type recombinase/integrase n=1 Tax=Komarekiella delphini-convector SJRDD-AB1 TaxID=2593771 RepID=A0AA40VVJ2_9NOST|nr:site-specific integrase [Komarekiella delphini-convector]MBD6621065.1 tyrosine-type recombinase/integrase [Komarekiella delphini-convector SJRDD-AB1]